MLAWEQHAQLSRRIGFDSFAIVQPAATGVNHLELQQAYKYIFHPHDISPSGLSKALKHQRCVLVKNPSHLAVLVKAGAILPGASQAKLVPLTALADAAQQLFLPKSLGEGLRKLAAMGPPTTRTVSSEPRLAAPRREEPLHAHGNPVITRLERER